MGSQAHETAAHEWPAGHRIAFRFLFAYLALYCFPFPERFLPGTSWLTDLAFDAWYRVDVWVGTRVLGLETISTAETGSGDRLCNYVQLLCILVVSVVATVVWSIVDRRRKEYTRLYGWLRVYLRYALAFTMLLFGVVKLLGGQFFPPSVLRLAETYGQSSPQTLLWTFMGASAAYTFFAGAMEVVGGVLLYFRRTTTLGALIVASVMTNVVMMNLCYDVPVKQFSLHLLFMAVVVLAPDLRRLGAFLLMHRPTQLRYVPLAISRPRIRAAVYGAKVLLIGSAIHLSTTMALESVRDEGPLAPKHPLYGYYEVEEFVANGDAVIPDANRWRTLIVARRGFVLVRTMTDARKHFMLGEDVSGDVLRVSIGGNATVHELHYTRPDPDHVVMEGRLQDDVIRVRLKKIDEGSFPLLGQKFRWINDGSG